MSADHSTPPPPDSSDNLPPTPGAEFIHFQLVAQAKQAAGTLRSLGVTAGEHVAVLLPMAPESVVVTMACGRLAAIRTTLPLGEPAGMLRRRLVESGARVVITADSCYYNEQRYAAKKVLDAALTGCPAVERVLVVHRLPGPVPWSPDRDLWWHQALDTLEE
ncbi:AMP-binding protein [Streptomyces sp. P38-E01]|uniref:AMP-binding protein n=1 Tax=Streptomyces tardus TaxID=2780544 RepID=A0A949JQN7_9ACTN|nr:AMP-binding protein [Streptomyces tardus]MBU7598450.1 AMP-binding protein [Streptomyces tardus]